MKLRIGIQLTTVSVFIIVTVFVSLVAIGLQYYFGQQMARSVAQNSYLYVSDSIVSQLTAIESQSANAVSIISEYPSLTEAQNETAIRRLFSEVLLQNPVFYGLYIGRPNGDFYELINLEASQEARQALQASPTDRWVVVRVADQDSERLRTFEYYDEQFQLRFQRQERTDYDPRRRPWFEQALRKRSLHQTEPYLFSQLQAPGMTLSKLLPDGESVIGLDLLLNSLSTFLKNQGFDEHSGQAYIFQDDGKVIAHSRKTANQDTLKAPAFEMTDAEQNWVAQQDVLNVSNELDWPPIDYTIGGQPRGYSIEVMQLISQMTGLKMNFVNGKSWQELVAAFRQSELDVLHSVFLTDNNREWGLATQSYASLPFALVSREQAMTMDSLAGKTLAIPSGWSIISIVQSRYPDIEIVETDSTLDAIKRVRRGEVDATMDNEIILRSIMSSYFIDDLTLNQDTGLDASSTPTDLVMMVNHENEVLLSLLNRAISTIQKTHKAALNERWLGTAKPVLVQTAISSVPTKELIALADNSEESRKLVPVTFEDKAHYAYVRAIETPNAERQRYFGVLVPQSVVTDPFMQQVKVSLLVSAGLLAIILPLAWAFAYPIVRPVRELADENDKIRENHQSRVKRVRSRILEIDQLSESIVDMVQTIKRQEQEQRDLMDAFIEVIAGAIDQKSPYTGGHCARVPQLALMLVKAADSSDAPAYKNFRVATRDAWRELRIAGWLHDCGKVITPEYVVDKATKLETIYNRIHEIRTRFEVLWRDAEIDCLNKTLTDPEQAPRWQQERDARRQSLQEDFAFIAQCNIGGEYLDEAKQTRLCQLAEITWLRHFNDHLGISEDEAQRYAESPAELPVTETLLQDRADHLIPRQHSLDYLDDFGITMEVPEYLYNRGELYNLLVSKGTLTTEERFKINEHIIGTIRMLEALPFPKELSNVPRYASTHHEKLDGRGYPRGLTGDQLSIPEHMLVLADIFEALTAADRPYKRGKTLTETLTILSRMVDDQHVDRNAFELLLTSGIYLRYAEKFMQPEQIDQVDISQYLQ